MRVRGEAGNRRYLEKEQVWWDPVVMRKDYGSSSTEWLGVIARTAKLQ